MLITISHNYSFINSCVNPVALYFVSGVFRQHFNRYLCCRNKRLLKRPTSNTNCETSFNSTYKRPNQVGARRCNLAPQPTSYANNNHNNTRCREKNIFKMNEYLLLPHRLCYYFFFVVRYCYLTSTCFLPAACAPLQILIKTNHRTFITGHAN